MKKLSQKITFFKKLSFWRRLPATQICPADSTELSRTLCPPFTLQNDGRIGDVSSFSDTHPNAPESNAPQVGPMRFKGRPAGVMEFLANRAWRRASAGAPECTSALGRAVGRHVAFLFSP